jgi:hypothetical protein
MSGLTNSDYSAKISLLPVTVIVTFRLKRSQNVTDLVKALLGNDSVNKF